MSFALLRPRTGHPWMALGLAAGAVLPTAAAAQSGPEIRFLAPRDVENTALLT
jgi:hypothetical protein